VIQREIGDAVRDLFDRFYRRSGHTASGNGLGLAIAREIASRHGTAIRLEDSPTLGGLRLTLKFAALDADAGSRGRLPRVASEPDRTMFLR
jgi:signal transduction histidine kinase